MSLSSNLKLPKSAGNLERASFNEYSLPKWWTICGVDGCYCVSLDDAGDPTSIGIFYMTLHCSSVTKISDHDVRSSVIGRLEVTDRSDAF
jgi:hypothetical protein